MRGLLFPLTIVLALAATVGLALLAFRDEPAAPPPDAADSDEIVVEEGARPVPAPGLRPYQTTATLAEDLRDALAADRRQLADECWRVSRALKSKARWTLLNIAFFEASPNVRALLVLAAGVHVADGQLLAGFLNDRASIVRRAAALAIGYQADGTARVELMEGLKVPVGRAPSREAVDALRKQGEREKDPVVAGDLRAVLSATSGR